MFPFKDPNPNAKPVGQAKPPRPRRHDEGLCPVPPSPPRNKNNPLSGSLSRKLQGSTQDDIVSRTVYAFGHDNRLHKTPLQVVNQPSKTTSNKIETGPIELTNESSMQYFENPWAWYDHDKGGEPVEDFDPFRDEENSAGTPLQHGAFSVRGPGFDSGEDAEQGSSVTTSAGDEDASRPDRPVERPRDGGIHRSGQSGEELVQAVLVKVHDAMEVHEDMDEPTSRGRLSYRVKALLFLALLIIGAASIAVSIVGVGKNDDRNKASGDDPTSNPDEPTVEQPTKTTPPTDPNPAIAWDDCFNSTDDVFVAVQNKDSPMYPVVVLCPHTVFDIGVRNPETDLYENGAQPLLLRSHLNYMCGADGALVNNCTIRGGDVQVRANYSFFGEEHRNVLIQGFKFEGAGNTAGLFNAGDVTFRACKFEDIDLQDGENVIEIDYDGGSFPHGGEDSGLVVKFDKVIFSDIRHRKNGSNPDQEIGSSIISAGDSRNEVVVNGCHFTNILFEGKGGSAVVSLGAKTTVIDSCFFEDNTFGDSAPVRVLLGTELLSANNYAPEHGGGCLGEFGDLSGADGIGCLAPETQVCGGGKTTCGVSFNATPPIPPEIPEIDFGCREPPLRIDMWFTGNSCSSPINPCQKTSGTCHNFNGGIVQGSQSSFIVAYDDTEALFEGIVNVGEVYFLGSSDERGLASNVTIEIYPSDGPRNNATIQQKVEFDASCTNSEYICLNQYGSSTVMAFTNESSVHVQCIETVDYNPKVTLTAGLPPEETAVIVMGASLRTNYTSFGIIPLPDLIGRVLDARSPIEIAVDASIDHRVSATYSTELRIVSRTVPFGISCLFQEEFVFTVEGQRLQPPATFECPGSR